MSSAILRIGRAEREPHAIAGLTLEDETGQRICELDIEYERLALFTLRNPIALDLLLLASCVYALDKSVLRAASGDAWTRSFYLTVPVSDPRLWNRARSAFIECLEFLTGDHWELTFMQLDLPVVYERRVRRRSQTARPIRGEVACLFSGGLDSLVGVINRLEADKQNILLVGHHDRDMAGPFSDQKALLHRLRAEYPQRISDVLVRVGQMDGSKDITLRGRSFLFIALGMFAASALGAETPVMIPENGTIAINVPLTPSRRGSCSTRTAHPKYLRSLGEGLMQVGLSNPIANPLGFQTKGEVVEGCNNQRLLRELAPLSVSCAKRSHRREWPRRTARSCGRCMPCIYRRAALHKVRLDNEIYGFDVCAGEVVVHANDEGGNDFRACLSFLGRNLPEAQLATALLANGSVDIRDLPAYAGVVQRSMDEIRHLLRDKATLAIRQAAGLGA